MKTLTLSVALAVVALFVVGLGHAEGSRPVWALTGCNPHKTCPSPTIAPSVPAPTPTPTPAPTPTPTPVPTPTPTPTATPNGCTVTLNAGATIAPATGQVICLHAGSYPGFYSAASGWTLKSYPGEWATIDGNLGAVRDPLVEVAGNNVTIASLTVQNSPTAWGAGIWLTGDDVTVGPQVELRHNHSFGIKIVGGALRAHLTQLNIWGNDTGLEAASGDISGFQLVDSWIHDHQTMIVDGTGGARGANATNFYHTTGAALISGNTIWNNRAVSVTYGHDGGAYEVYGSTGLTYDGNTEYDNQNVMELGTDGAANSVTFTNNNSYMPATSTAPVPGPAMGIILRACVTCTFTGNTYRDLTSFGFTVDTSGFTGGVVNSGVTVQTSQFEELSGQRAISIGTWTGITVDHNTYYLQGGTVGYSPLHTGDVQINGPMP